MFSKALHFNDAERRRVAPVAGPQRVLIAVEQIAESTPQVSGLIDLGMALRELTRLSG